MSPTPEQFYGYNHQRRRDDKLRLTRMLVRGALFFTAMVLLCWLAS